MSTLLRRTVDVACALCVTALVGGVIYFAKQEATERQAILAVASDLARFRQTLTTRAAYNGTDLNSRGWPNTIDPKWFQSDPPRNMLVTPDRPWVDVATSEEALLKDPPVRMTVSRLQASFWYNPFQGIIRARVPVVINDRKALEMYNTVNGTSLDSIYAPPPPVKVAVAEPPKAGPVPARAVPGVSVTVSHSSEPSKN
jgi:hypothetical protein